MEALIREAEGDLEQPFLLWDTVWKNDALEGTFADWVLAGPSEPNNSLGLSALHALHTAILISLFTWRRAEPYDVLPGSNDPQGWWGDAIDLEDDETKLGSRLWLLYRGLLNDQTARTAEDYCYEALQPLIDQGAVAKFVVNARPEIVKGWLVIAVDGYSQSGQLIYSQKFERLWRQEFP